MSQSVITRSNSPVLKTVPGLLDRPRRRALHGPSSGAGAGASCGLISSSSAIRIFIKDLVVTNR